MSDQSHLSSEIQPLPLLLLSNTTHKMNFISSTVSFLFTLFARIIQNTITKIRKLGVHLDLLVGRPIHELNNDATSSAPAMVDRNGTVQEDTKVTEHLHLPELIEDDGASRAAKGYFSSRRNSRGRQQDCISESCTSELPDAFSCTEGYPATWITYDPKFGLIDRAALIAHRASGALRENSDNVEERLHAEIGQDERDRIKILGEGHLPNGCMEEHKISSSSEDLSLDKNLIEG